tara:strand:- start:6469 stop:6648 length:180 start_codon:yes stop_codon:yes gene_type:complete
MPTNAINYIDAKAFSEATAVFLDSELTILASDGFYSDSNISREQLNGVLLPAQECQTCP